MLYLHMLITIIDEKGSHEFERQQGRIYGRAWMKEMEEENDVIMTSKNKRKIKLKIKIIKNHDSVIYLLEFLNKL